ncbi:chemotaxis protein CheA [Pelagicoccus sp. SDUM812003]|uniref:chemotaxis protein CheA n=1 Tax=Pelagicoccus sp. SDUM812003 TaxID=3041267 RepID=UPI00280DD578|nr:chemotaxis protein CheA [Pelagicoccus sp. SDUM812003]MDQ8204347.1 chemotaxis protein CheA [Pelagicoccus sp. SDUM812003]
MDTNEILEHSRRIFRIEAVELLSELDGALLKLENDPGNENLINRVFRAMHTLKGSGATSGYDRLAGYLHRVEEVYNAAREGRVVVQSEIIDLSLKVCDVVNAFLQTAEAEADEVFDRSEDVVEELCRFLPAEGGQSKPETRPQSEGSGAAWTYFRIVFAPAAELFFNGSDPVMFLQDLRSLGACQVELDEKALPDLESIDAERCYLSWHISLVSECDEETVREVFQFIEDDCELRIESRSVAEAPVFAASVYFERELLRDFREECAESLADAERWLLALEAPVESEDALGSVFRCLHNLKSSARLMASQAVVPIPGQHPLQLINRVTHAAEGVIELRREQANETAIESKDLQILFQAVDLVKECIDAIDTERFASEAVESLMAQLRDLGGEDLGGVNAVGSLDTKAAMPVSASVASGAIEQSCVPLEALLVALAQRGEFGKDELRMGIRALNTVGLALRDLRETEAEQQAISCCQRLEAALDAQERLGGEEAKRVGAELAALLSAFKARKACGGAGGSAVSTRAATAEARPSAGASVRVDQDKLDRLMRTVGELLVARGAFPVMQRKAIDGESGALTQDLKVAGDTISRIADELQNTVMAIRMLPIRSVFQRFPRLVRDLARASGKEIAFETEGDDVELDKTVLEQIGDPLVHLVRNALDHGIEPPQERELAGKRRSGTLRLKVSQRSSSVFIEVSDDGRGLDPAKLRAKAVEKGLMDEQTAACLDDAAARELIFHAGFSTAAKVTDISGRGVGMDVVRNNIGQLHGTIEIRSELGKGTTFVIQLPTSLLVSKGVLVRSGAELYLLPSEAIETMVKVPRDEVRAFRRSRFVQIRGEVIPLIDLSEALDSPRGSVEVDGADAETLAVAVVRGSQGKLGVSVDAFLEQLEVIVKPMGEQLRQMDLFQGACILGDGSVVLVLDPSELATA